MTVLYAATAVTAVHEESKWSWHLKLLILLLAVILAVIAIPLVTVGYIVHIVVFLARKCVRPTITLDERDGKIGLFKLHEGVLEANFQAALGLFSFLAVQR